jgi:hypothetical protein
MHTSRSQYGKKKKKKICRPLSQTPCRSTQAEEKKKSVRKKKTAMPKAKSFSATADVSPRVAAVVAASSGSGFSKSYDRLPANAPAPVSAASERKSPRRRLSKSGGSGNSVGGKTRAASPAAAVDAVVGEVQVAQTVSSAAAAAAVSSPAPVHTLQQLNEKRAHEPAPKAALPTHSTRTALAGASSHVAQLRNYNNAENPEEDYDDEFFWGSSDDEDADAKPVVFGHFRNTADLVQRLGDEKLPKKRRQFRTANSDDKNDDADSTGGGDTTTRLVVAARTWQRAMARARRRPPSTAATRTSGYDDVERALQSFGIADAARQPRRQGGAAQRRRHCDVVESSSGALRVERVHDSSNESGSDDDADDDDNNNTNDDQEMAPAHVAARKARSARHHALSQDSSDSSDGAHGRQHHRRHWRLDRGRVGAHAGRGVQGARRGARLPAAHRRDADVERSTSTTRPCRRSTRRASTCGRSRRACRSSRCRSATSRCRASPRRRRRRSPARW